MEGCELCTRRFSILGKRGSGSSVSEFGRSLPAPIRSPLTPLRHNSSKYMSIKPGLVYWHAILIRLVPLCTFPDCRIRFNVLDKRATQDVQLTGLLVLGIVCTPQEIPFRHGFLIPRKQN